MNREDFLLRDYELKIGYLSDHFGRMWTRFNYFVTIETAIIGGNLLFGKDNYLLLAFLGAGVSLIWYVMGAEDRFLVRVYRRQVAEAFEEIASTIYTDKNDPDLCWFVGDIDKTVEVTNKRVKNKLEKGEFYLGNELSGWRYKPVSTTRLAALIPLLVFVIWVLVLNWLTLPCWCKGHI